MDEQIQAISSTYIYPGVIFFVMFALGLSLNLKALAAVAKDRTALLVGAAGQLVFLPIVAISLALSAPFPAAVALGLALVSLCPGGSTSNAIVFAIDGKVALSVTLTVISSLVTLFTIPLALPFVLDLIAAGAEEVGAVALPSSRIFRSLAVMTALPIGLGMLARKVSARAADAVVPALKPISLLLIVLIVGLSMYNARAFIFDAWAPIVGAAAVQAFLVVGGGFVLARLFGLALDERMTVAIEIGVQNTPMAIYLASSVLGRPDLNAVAILYGTINYATIFALIVLTRRARKSRADGEARAAA